MESSRRSSRATAANPSLGAAFGTPPGRPGPSGRPPSAGQILGMTNLPKRPSRGACAAPRAALIHVKGEEYQRAVKSRVRSAAVRDARRRLALSLSLRPLLLFAARSLPAAAASRPPWMHHVHRLSYSMAVVAGTETSRLNSLL